MAVLSGPRGLVQETDSPRLRLGMFMKQQVGPRGPSKARPVPGCTRVHVACQVLRKAQSRPSVFPLMLLVTKRRTDSYCQFRAPVPVNADRAGCVCALSRARPAPAPRGGHHHGLRLPG